MVHGEGHLCTDITLSGQTEHHRCGIQEDRQTGNSAHSSPSITSLDHWKWACLPQRLLPMQLSIFVSWRPDPEPEAMAMDAFTLTWTSTKAYANPLSGSSAVPDSPIEGESSSIWKIQTWYPRILEMCTDHLRIIPETQPDPGKSYPGNTTHTV